MRAVACGAALVTGLLTWAAPSGADVAEVGGGAFGQDVTISVAGGTPVTSGPAPAVAAAPDGGSARDVAPSSTVGAADATGLFGGAYLRTGLLTVTAWGRTGRDGSVTTAATAGAVEALGGALTAHGVSAACVADAAGPRGTVKVSGGRLAVSATETVDLPPDPAPGTTLTATTGSGERLTLVLNEQQVVEGQLVVVAVRVVLDGPEASGRVVVASARCGVSTTAPPATAPEPATATTATSTPADAALDAGDSPTDETTTADTTTADTTTADTTTADTTTADTTTADTTADDTTTDDTTTADTTTADTTADDTTADDTTAGDTTDGTTATEEATAMDEEAAPVAPPDPSLGVRAAAGALQAVTVSSVTGGAFGAYGQVSLFGSPPLTLAAEPAVTLPATGSASPVTASAAKGLIEAGPAKLFMWDAATVRTQGTTGVDGSVTSSVNITGGTDEPPGPVLADRFASTCTATATGVTGSTTLTNGRFETQYELDRSKDNWGEAIAWDPLPANPAPNTERTGRLEHLGDSFRVVLNEQVRGPDGSLTVNAFHMFMLGPTAVGEIIVGQSRCGVATAAAEPPAAAETAVSGGTTGDGTAPVASAAARSTGTGSAASPSSAGTAVAGASQSRGGAALATTGGSGPRLASLALLLAALVAARLRRTQGEEPPARA